MTDKPKPKPPKPRPPFDGTGKETIDTLAVGNNTTNDIVNNQSQGAFGDSRNAMRDNPLYWTSPATWAIEARDALFPRPRYVEDKTNFLPGAKAFDKARARLTSPEGVAGQKAYGEGIMKGKAKVTAITKAKAKIAPKPAAPTPSYTKAGSGIKAPTPIKIVPSKSPAGMGVKGSSTTKRGKNPA
jgi:hypothetical protein